MPEVTAIDVEQGDSLLIVTAEGKTILLDSRGVPGQLHSDIDVGEEVVSPYLWSRGFRRLDAVAISHPYSDHVGGMRSIIANFRPRELWYGLESPTPEFTGWRRPRESSELPSSREPPAKSSILAACKFVL